MNDTLIKQLLTKQARLIDDLKSRLEKAESQLETQVNLNKSIEPVIKKGEKGVSGARGQKGERGAQGAKGERGERGYNGKSLEKIWLKNNVLYAQIDGKRERVGIIQNDKQSVNNPKNN